MKRILIFSPTGGYAGIDVCLENLVCNLDRKKFYVTIVLPNEAFLYEKFNDMGIKCYELSLKWWFPIGVSGKDLPSMFVENKSNIDAIKKIIVKENIDLVLSNTTISLDGCIASAICRIPHLFFMHARFVDNIYVNMLPQTKELIYRLMGSASVKVVCCSELLEKQMREYIDNVTHITNGIDTTKFSFNQKSLNKNGKTILNIVMIGHFNENKQHDFVIEALRKVKEKDEELISKIHYTAIGPGEKEYLDKLKSMVKKYDLRQNVTFESFEDNVPERLKEYNLYVNSSITETLPLSVMEAMSSGLPVVATPTDGSRLIVEEGKCGFICETPQQMADRFCQFLEDETLVEIMSRNARKRVENFFSVEQYVKNFENLFENIISQKSLVNEKFSQNVSDLYDTLTLTPCQLKKELSILVVYPVPAMATFVLAAKKPLEYLKKFHKLSLVYKDLPEVESDDIEKADVVYCIRYYHDAAHELLKKTHNMGKGFVWYIDDNYDAVKFQDGAVIHQENKNDLYEYMFENSDYVIVNNKQIYSLGKKFTDKIICLPTYQEISHTKFKSNKPEGIIRFGFMGTLNRDGDFDCVVDAIDKALDEYGSRIEVEFIGYYPSKLKKRKQIHHFDFINDYDAFRTFFESREWDFALAPLSDTQFNRSKTNNKYREYSSYAIPGIFSNISTYSDCVKDHDNGILVDNNADDWYVAIAELIQSQDLCKKIGSVAQQNIIMNYGISKFADPLYDIFLEVADCGDDNDNRNELTISDAPNAIREGKDMIPVQHRYGWYYGIQKTDAKALLKQINPMLYGILHANIPMYNKRPCCLSAPIPFQTYVEYEIKGVGEDVNFIFVGKDGSLCTVEIVEEGKIVFNGLVKAGCCTWSYIALGNVRGKLQIRFQAKSPKDIVRVVEMIEKKCIFGGKRELCGWIS